MVTSRGIWIERKRARTRQGKTNRQTDGESEDSSHPVICVSVRSLINDARNNRKKETKTKPCDHKYHHEDTRVKPAITSR